VDRLSDLAPDLPRLACVALDSLSACFDGLTAPQRAAVEHESGPLLVLAGPGSGKTRVITRRIAARIARGVPAWSILALTFSNKAAREMRTRVELLCGGRVAGRGGPTISTFHAFSAQLLRRFGGSSLAAGLGTAPLREDFSILDAEDASTALRQAISDSGLDPKQWRASTVAAHISRAKNQLWNAAEHAAHASDFLDRTVAKVHAAYERELSRQNALDFDDLLTRCARMLRDDANLRCELQQRYTEILVDEYQDTNHSQFVIAKLLAQEHRNICVVGDPDQSIYGWRGADLNNILEFEEHFPRALIVPLGENFRSTGHIVAAAARLILHNGRRRHKELHTSLGDGEVVEALRLEDEIAEAERVAGSIERLHAAGMPLREMAVLMRMNALTRVVEDALRRRNIPCVIARGTAFFERREVRDALAYLRLIANPLDEVSLQRIVNVPVRGIGSTTMQRIGNAAALRRIPLFDALQQASSLGITERTVKSINGFVALVARARSELDVKPAGNLGGFVSRVLLETGLGRAAAASAESEEEGAEREANVTEVANAAALHEMPEGDPAAPPPTLGDALRSFLQSVALVADADAVDPEKGAVTLMTLHASKGLEFDSICIIGLEEGLLPHARSLGSPDEVEEERRLLYVGMTRARRHLLMTTCSARTVRGLQERTIESGFLREISGEGVASSDEADGASQIRMREPSGMRRLGGSGSASASAPSGAPRPALPAASVGGSRQIPSGIRVGTVVRHAQFGIGRITALLPRGSMTSVEVDFRPGGRRTLVLEYARLEIVAGS